MSKLENRDAIPPDRPPGEYTFGLTEVSEDLATGNQAFSQPSHTCMKLIVGSLIKLLLPRKLSTGHHSTNLLIDISINLGKC